MFDETLGKLSALGEAKARFLQRHPAGFLVGSAMAGIYVVGVLISTVEKDSGAFAIPVEAASKVLHDLQQHGRIRQEIKQRMIRSCDRSVKLPPGKHSDPPGPDCFLHDVFRARNPLSREPRVNCSQHFFVNWGFCQRQQHGLIHRIGGTLRFGIKLADRLNFIAKEFNAQRPVSLRRIDI